ncbi:MAG: ParB/RepB/Spo0J family partition protein [Candidatus Cloacimonetes bacterium]|nr:ParB/RepB/Spo0J family partition protein [Candidatus Cloacimonadota bacterium]
MTRLGKGLDALIHSGPESTDKTTGITTLKTNSIIPNRYQPRKRFDVKKLQELAESLKENGIIQPIIVTKRNETQYELIAGERRLEASKLAGFDEVPVIIRSVSDKEQLQFAIIENVQREDLNPIEEAMAYQQLNDEFGLTHAQISNIVGKDRATISNFIRLLKLSVNIQNLLLEGKLSSGHARAILQVDASLQEEFAGVIIKNSLSVRKTELMAKKIKETGVVTAKREEPEDKPELMQVEEILSKSFHTQVKIYQKNHKGRVSFYFSNRSQLDALLKALNISNE